MKNKKMNPHRRLRRKPAVRKNLNLIFNFLRTFFQVGSQSSSLSKKIYRFPHISDRFPAAEEEVDKIMQ